MSLTLSRYEPVILPTALMWLVGAASADLLSDHRAFWLGWSIIVLLALLVVIAQSRHYRRLTRWFLALFAFCLGGVYFSLMQYVPVAQDVLYHAPDYQAELSGILTSRGHQPGQWVLSVDHYRGRPATGQVLLKGHPIKQMPLVLGSHVLLRGQLSEPPQASYPGDFDYRDYLRHQHIGSVLRVRSVKVLTTDLPRFSPLGLLRLADESRARMAGLFQEALPGVPGQVMASVVLGEHAVGLAQTTRQAFREAGLIHILAASGLNVGVIGGVMLLITTWLKFPTRLRLIVAMLSVAFYALVTGLPPSVQRAAMMFEVALALKWMRQSLTPPVLLALAGVLLSLVNPMVVGMLGFQLSFLSTWGILTMVPALQDRLQTLFPQALIGAIAVPCVAQLWVSPVLLYHFDQIQLLSLPANLLAIPWAIGMTYVGFILGALGLFWPEGAVKLLSGFTFLPAGLTEVAQRFASLPYASLSLSAPPWPVVITMLLGCVALSFILMRSGPLNRALLLKGYILWGLLVLLPWNIALWQASHTYRLTVLPDRGDMIWVFQAPGPYTVAGVSQLNSWQGKRLGQLLRKLRSDRLDALILQEAPRPRAKLGLKQLTERLPVGTVLSPLGVDASQNQQVLTRFREHVGTFQWMTSTEQLHSSSWTGKLYHAAPSETMLLGILPHKIRWAIHVGPTPLSASMLKPVTTGAALVVDHRNRQGTVVYTAAGKGSPLKQYQQWQF